MDEAMRPMTTDERRWTLAVFALLALLFFWRLGALPLMEPDEGRYTDIPNAMLVSGDWVTPRLNGVLYFEKPPMYYWLTAAAIRVFGLNEFASRFWRAALGLAGVWLTFVLARRLAGARAAIVAAVVLGSAPVYMGTARVCIIDMTLTFFSTATLVCFWLARGAAPGWRRALAWHGVFAFAAVTVLTKGLIGVVIPGAVIGVFVVLAWEWRLLRQVPWVTGPLVFTAIAAPWHVLMAQRHPDFLWFYFIHEHVLRFATKAADRQEAWWFFAAIVLLGCLPWTGLLPAVVRSFPGRGFVAYLRARREMLFLLAWFAFVLVFFSASQSKLIPYILPGLPALAILVGIVADRLARGAQAGTAGDAVALALAAALSSAYGVLFVWAGLGRIDRLGLGGQLWPGFLAGGCAILLAAAALAVVALRSSWPRRLAALAACGYVVSAVIVLVSPHAGRDRNSRDLAAALRPVARAEDVVVSYHDFLEGLPVYLGRRVAVFSYIGELKFGLEHLTPGDRSTWFPSHDELRTLWRSDRRVFLACPQSTVPLLVEDGLPGGHLVWQGPTSAIYSNRPPA